MVDNHILYNHNDLFCVGFERSRDPNELRVIEVASM